MLHTYEYKNLSWVDLQSPARSEIKEVMQKFGVHPTIGDELLAPTLSPSLDVYKDYVYLILHFPAIKHTHSNEQNQEVDFILGKNFVVTAHYDTVDSLHKFSKEFEVHTIIDKSIATKHAGYLFSHMIKKLYHSLGHELEFIASRLKKIEDHIFRGEEKAMVQALSEVSRNLLDIKRTIFEHGDILSLLEDAGKTLYGPSFVGELKAIQREYKRTLKEIDSQLEFLTELRNTNDSLLSTKQNEVMKVLTIMAFVTFPLSLIASIFGMNTETLPLVGFKGDFWLVIGIMLLLTTIFFAYFKYKKWL